MNETNTMQYLKEMAFWQRAIADAVSSSQAFPDAAWHCWFNIFDGELNLIHDFNPIASLVSCKLNRGVSIHLRQDISTGNRWARLREFAVNTQNQIDHLVITGNLTLSDEAEVKNLICSWLLIGPNNEHARQDLVDAFSS